MNEHRSLLVGEFGTTNYTDTKMRSNGSHFRESLVEDQVEKNENFSKAALLIRNAIIGDPHVGRNWSFNPYNHGKHPIRNMAHHIAQFFLTSRLFASFIHVTHSMLVILSFIEQPFWCILKSKNDDERSCVEILESHGSPAFLTGSEEGNVDVSYYPSWNIAVLSPFQSATIESSCVLILIFYVILLVMRDGLSLRMFFDKSTKLKVLRIAFVSGLFLMSMELVLFRPNQFLTGKYSLRFNHWVRALPLFLRMVVHVTFSPSIIREIKRTAHILPYLMNVLVVLFVLIIIYAWVGNIVYFGEGKGFDSLADSIWLLWDTLTATYPDSMLPLYNDNRLSSFYFTTYMVFSNLFLMNVILGAVYNNYSDLKEGYEAKQGERGQAALSEAYTLLSKDGYEVDKDSIKAVFYLINQNCPGMRYIKEDEMEILFNILDNDGSNTVSEEEFLDFHQVMLLELRKVGGENTVLNYLFPNLTDTEWYEDFKYFLQSETFDYIIDGLLVLNAVVIIIQNYPQISGDTSVNIVTTSNGNNHSVFEYVQFFFTIAFVLETATKILVFGWTEYKADRQNLFDFTITTGSVISTLFVYEFKFLTSTMVVRVVNSTRVLRLIRLLSPFPNFSIIAAVFYDIAGPAYQLLKFLFVIIYTFSAFGMAFFGGFVTRDPSNPFSYRLEGSDFAEGQYWPNNFNDMMSSVIVLFNLMLGHSDVQAIAFEQVAGTKWTRVYFFSYFILGSIVVSNIVIALIMDKFLEEYERIKSVGDVDLRRQSGAIFEDGSSGRYMVKLKRKAYVNKDDDRADLMHSMLSHESDRKVTFLD